jgi:hypothetical protein
MNLTTVRKFDSMKTIVAAKQSVWVGSDMVVIFFKDFSHKFMFGMMNCLDNETIVS